MTENPSYEQFFSAVVTFTALAILFRIYLHRTNKKRPKIQRPDWLKDKKRR